MAATPLPHRNFLPRAWVLTAAALGLLAVFVPPSVLARAGGGHGSRSSSSGSSGSSSSGSSSSSSSSSNSSSTPSRPVFITFKVRGNTTKLSSIADQYRTSPGKIRELTGNIPLVDNKYVKSGTTLTLPDSQPLQAYQVKKGQTFASIARALKIDESDLRSANKHTYGQGEPEAGDWIFLPYKMSLFEKICWGFVGLLCLGGTLIVIFIAYKITRPGRSSSAAKAQGAAPPGSPAPRGGLDAKIAALKKQDPGFNVQNFEDHVSTAFFRIQNAWCSLDLSQCEDDISPQMRKRYELQLQEYHRTQTRARMEDLSLDKVQITDVISGDRFDTIQVWITATARDYKVDLNGNWVSGSRDLVTWDEQWSFLRSVHAHSGTDVAPASTHCPNCGAPLEIKATGACQYCKAPVSRSDFDWVLSEITQLNQ